MTSSRSSDALGALPPNEELPWIMRLRPVWGWILTFVFGCAGMYVAYLQFGLQSLHGIWVSLLLLATYYYAQDYLRLRVAIQKLSATTPNDDIAGVREELSTEFAARLDKELNARSQLQAIIKNLESSLIDLASKQGRREEELKELESQLMAAIKSSEEVAGSRFSELENKIGLIREELQDLDLELRSDAAYDKARLIRYDMKRFTSDKSEALRVTLGSLIQGLAYEARMSERHFRRPLVNSLIGTRLEQVEELIGEVGTLQHDEVEKLERILDSLKERQPTRVKRLRSILEDVGS